MFGKDKSGRAQAIYCALPPRLIARLIYSNKTIKRPYYSQQAQIVPSHRVKSGYATDNDYHKGS